MCIYSICFFLCLSVFDECSVASWNQCDKTNAKCTNTFATYNCHCKTGYEDFLGTGASCMGKTMLLTSYLSRLFGYTLDTILIQSNPLVVWHLMLPSHSANEICLD